MIAHVLAAKGWGGAQVSLDARRCERAIVMPVSQASDGTSPTRGACSWVSITLKHTHDADLWVMGQVNS